MENAAATATIIATAATIVTAIATITGNKWIKAAAASMMAVMIATAMVMAATATC